MTKQRGAGREAACIWGYGTNRLVGSGAALEGFVVEVMEETRFDKSDIGECAGPELTARRPDQPPVIHIRPLPFRLFHAAIRWPMQELMFVPVAAFSRRAADLGVCVFPKDPAGPEGLLKDVALIGDARGEVAIEIPAFPQ